MAVMRVMVKCSELIPTCAAIKCSSSRPWSWASCKAPSRQSGSPLPCECFSLRVNIINTLQSKITTNAGMLDCRNAEARSFLWHPPTQIHFSLLRCEHSSATSSVDIRISVIWPSSLLRSNQSTNQLITLQGQPGSPPVSSVARVAPQNVSQRFEAPNALVDIPQHSLARRHPGVDRCGKWKWPEKAVATFGLAAENSKNIKNILENWEFI